MPIEPTSQELADALAAATGANTAPTTEANEPAGASDPIKPMPPVVGGINLAAETPEQLAGLISTAREFGLSDNDAAKFAAGPVTVTQTVHDQYAALKVRVMNDKAWVQRYMDGGQTEQALMWEINARLSADVVEG